MCTCSNTQNFMSVQIISLSPQIVQICAQKLCATIFIEALCLSNKILEAEQFIKSGLLSSQVWMFKSLVALASADPSVCITAWQMAELWGRVQEESTWENRKPEIRESKLCCLKIVQSRGELTHSMTLILGAVSKSSNYLLRPSSRDSIFPLNTATLRTKLLTHELVGDRLHLTITCYFHSLKLETTSVSI